MIIILEQSWESLSNKQFFFFNQAPKKRKVQYFLRVYIAVSRRENESEEVGGRPGAVE